MAHEIPETHLDILDKKGFAHIATIGPDGEPQSSPVWYGWDGERLLFSNLRTRQKAKNLTRDPRVAVSITDPDNPYRYLEIRGSASIVKDPDKSFLDEMSHKYMGKDYPWSQPGDERVVISVVPDHVTCMG